MLTLYGDNLGCSRTLSFLLHSFIFHIMLRQTAQPRGHRCGHAKPIPQGNAVARPLQMPRAHRRVKHRDVRMASEGGFFTPEFAAALQAALSRNEEALTASSQTSVEEPQLSTQEEMLIAALRTAQTNVRQMTLVKRELDAFLAREQKQMERLELALEAIQRDVAYYRSLDERLRSRDEEAEREKKIDLAAAMPAELQAVMERVSAPEEATVSQEVYPWSRQEEEREPEYQRVDDWRHKDYPVADGWAREPDRPSKEWFEQFSNVRPGEYDPSRVAAASSDSSDPYSSWRQDAEDRYAGNSSSNDNGYGYGSSHSELDGDSREEHSDWRGGWRDSAHSNGNGYGSSSAAEERQGSWWRDEPQDSRSGSSRGWEAPEPEPAAAQSGSNPDWMDNWRNI